MGTRFGDQKSACDANHQLLLALAERNRRNSELSGIPGISADPAGRATLTGWRRRRTTRRSVLFFDSLARYLICGGGLGVTIALGLIIAFLFWVAWPLFRRPAVESLHHLQLPLPASTQPAGGGGILAMGCEESLAAVWLLDDQGWLTTWRVDGAELVHRQRLVDQPIVAFSEDNGTIGLGLADGKVRIGQIRYEYSFLSARQLPDAADSLQPGQSITFDGKVGQMTPAGQLRLLAVVADLHEPLTIGKQPARIRLVYYFQQETYERLAVLLDDGRLLLCDIGKKKNMMTGQVRRTVRDHELPAWRPASGADPVALLLGSNGQQLYLICRDGWTARYNLQDPARAFLAEETDLLPAEGAQISSVRTLLGSTTLVVADSLGGVSGWFPVRSTSLPGKDGLKLIRAHRLQPQAHAITTIGISRRDRQFVTGDALGNLVLWHMTSESIQRRLSLPEGAAVLLAQLSPKSDAIAVLDARCRLSLYSLSNPHVDATLAQLWLPVHYEGYENRGFVYQSSAATEDAEPKLSLVPLIFGTLKATFYALLFAVPVAILGAIYTSEFMQPQVRAAVKPTVEMMASLPSVVLGFIGAMVLAPVIENVVFAVLLLFVAVPLGVLLGGSIWQMLPLRFTSAVPSWLKFGLMVACVLASGWLAYRIGPHLEELLFLNPARGRGDMRGWLAREFGSATPGWVVLLTPLLAVLLTLLWNLRVKPKLGLHQHHSSRAMLGTVELLRMLATGLTALSLASLIGWGFSSLGLDLRASLFGPYVQRNSLVVGMMMGFAIIPIIYTLSEDALSSVPASLRSASLGAGATPWQTVVRVVLPLASSGIFSACMIGLGRAVGETMIVLMVAGNTPIMDISLFNGLRALSANIAVELPEAPVNSTHYRVLFLSAVVLFVMTFVVNTAAELVRLRFRRKSHGL